MKLFQRTRLKMNPCLGLCLRRLFWTPAPPYACPGMLSPGFGNKPSSGPWSASVPCPPSKADVSPTALMTRSSRGKKTFQKLKCVFLVVNEAPQVRCPGFSRYLVSSALAEMGCDLFGFCLLWYCPSGTVNLKSGNKKTHAPTKRHFLESKVSELFKEIHFLLI